MNANKGPMPSKQTRNATKSPAPVAGDNPSANSETPNTVRSDHTTVRWSDVKKRKSVDDYFKVQFYRKKS